MLYSILCYHCEKTVGAWTPAQEAATLERLAVIQRKLAQQGKLGPVVRLMPTSTATTLRKEQSPPVMLDGPFAETKEQLLGFFVVDCASREETHEIARELAAANPGGAYEIRPVAVINPHGDGKVGPRQA
ncbi:MAG: YciI family protein [Steroidobacteraceae bacterium]